MNKYISYLPYQRIPVVLSPIAKLEKNTRNRAKCQFFTRTAVFRLQPTTRLSSNTSKEPMVRYFIPTIWIRTLKCMFFCWITQQMIGVIPARLTWKLSLGARYRIEFPSGVFRWMARLRVFSFSFTYSGTSSHIYHPSWIFFY